MALQQHIEEITDILKREVRSFNAILELLIREEKCLIECDTEALSEVLEKQEDVFNSIACLERSRTDVLSKIAEETGDDPGLITISGLSEKIDGPVRRELIETGHVLMRLNEEIQRKKSTNTMLINQSIMLVESDLRLIVGAINRAQDNEAGYDSKADSNRTPHGVRLDQRM